MDVPISVISEAITKNALLNSEVAYEISIGIRLPTSIHAFSWRHVPHCMFAPHTAK